MSLFHTKCCLNFTTERMSVPGPGPTQLAPSKRFRRVSHACSRLRNEPTQPYMKIGLAPVSSGEMLGVSPIRSSSFWVTLHCAQEWPPEAELWRRNSFHGRLLRGGRWNCTRKSRNQDVGRGLPDMPVASDLTRPANPETRKAKQMVALPSTPMRDAD